MEAIEQGSLGFGSVAEGEYLRNMTEARLRDDGSARWVEVCFCEVPLAEERPYSEEFFELVKVQDAHARHCCRDLIGSEPWACSSCAAPSNWKQGSNRVESSFLMPSRQQVHPLGK